MRPSRLNISEALLSKIESSDFIFEPSVIISSENYDYEPEEPFIKFFRLLKGNTTIRELTLDPQVFGDISKDRQSIKELAAVLKYTKIISLKIIGIDDITSDEMAYLAEGLKGSCVTHFVSRDCDLTDEDVQTLSKVLRHTQITNFQIVDNKKLGDEGFKALGEGLVNSLVSNLDVSSNSITGEGAEGLTKGLKDTRIIALNFKHSSLRGVGVKGFFENIQGSALSYLKLENACLNGDGFTLLSKILPNTNIKYLNLQFNLMACEGAIALAMGLKGSKVQELSLCGNDIEDEGAKAIGSVLAETSISILDLKINKIGDEGATGIATGVQNSLVKNLSLCDNYIQIDGALELAKALKNTIITTFDIRRNLIINNGAQTLIKEAQNSLVTTLLLGEGNGIDHHGYKKISDALKDNYHIVYIGSINVHRLGASKIMDILERNEAIAPYVNAIEAFTYYSSTMDSKAASLVETLASNLQRAKEAFKDSYDNWTLFTQALELMTPDLPAGSSINYDTVRDFLYSTELKMQEEEYISKAGETAFVLDN